MSKKEIENLKSILMKLLTRHLELESEVRTLRVALQRTNIITEKDFTDAEVIAKQAEQALLKLEGASPEEVLEEFLRNFQGPKQ